MTSTDTRSVTLAGTDNGNHCAVCDKPLGPGFLMCAAHWHMVPRDLKTDVYRTWGALARSRRYPLRLDAMFRREYFEARDKAIAAVNARLGDDQATDEGVIRDDHE